VRRAHAQPSHTLDRGPLRPSIGDIAAIVRLRVPTAHRREWLPDVSIANAIA